jgi:hypothetical protein
MRLNAGKSGKSLRHKDLGVSPPRKCAGCPGSETGNAPKCLSRKDLEFYFCIGSAIYWFRPRSRPEERPPRIRARAPRLLPWRAGGHVRARGNGRVQAAGRFDQAGGMPACFRGSRPRLAARHGRRSAPRAPTIAWVARSRVRGR